MIKVIGHFPPDTDTVCSPIAYAWYLNKYKNKEAKPFRAGELNRETQYVLNHFGVDVPDLLEEISDSDELIIMDTNNPEEILKGHDKAKVLEIIDHHKLVGGISTADPINITMRAVACTATIVYEMMISDNNKDLPKEIAGVMLASILSDTLNFTSPTTTDRDKEAAEALVQIAGVNSDELASEMFAAKSNLEGFTSEQILTMDGKKFDMGDKKVMVSVLETTLPENALVMRNDLETAMENMKAEKGYDMFFFFIVDIINNSSKLMLVGNGEEEIAKKAFGKDVSNGLMELPGVVSRKKQMVPVIEKAVIG